MKLILHLQVNAIGILLFVLVGSLMLMQTTEAFIDNNKDDPLKGTGSILDGGRYFERGYHKLNSYLLEKVDSNDFISNIEFAAFKDYTNSEKVGLFERPFVGALKQFLDLFEVFDSCDMKSYAILYKNHKATSAYANRAQTSDGPIRRTENVIYQVSNLHAKQCQDLYQHNFQLKFKELDKEQLELVDAFAGEIVNKRYEDYWENKDISHNNSFWLCSIMYALFIRNEVSLLKNEAQLTYNAIKKHIEDKDGKNNHLVPVTNENSGSCKVYIEKLTELYSRYIVEPCNYFVNQVSEIFEPAKFDAMWHLDMRDGENEATRDYYVAWAKYRVCERFIRRDQAALFKGLVRIVSQQKL